MRRATFTVAALTALVLAGCGEPGSAGQSPEATAPEGDQLEVCEAIPGEQLVVLDDDQGLQTVDNVVPALHGPTATDDENLVGLLDEVSALLTSETLIELNRAVDVDRRTSTEVAAELIESEGLDDQPDVGQGRPIVVGAGNFSESATLAALYAGVLDAAGYETVTQTIGNRETYLPALETGVLTVVPEYVGTLTEVLNQRVNGADAPAVASSDLEETLASLRDLGEGAGLVIGEPAEAQNRNAFAVTTAFADEHGVSTLSELAAVCAVDLGGPPECPERPFCQPGLEDTYGLQVVDFTSLDAGGPLTKAALQQGQIAVGLVFSSDAALAPQGPATADD
ncbi:glycine betaine ABC transporter substrate-binding protein [Cellulomonas bogoriensis]|uniref:Glycine/betaine ABC transporter substrate-binding protein n=1 Tax=Cellulomonas bogoriensis 69B4 = DSM 16987 TaxID=1386082 RepID=A0A0A0C3G9_9CELL|nr:glycine betaine ABC transporter substrate-binding protein [Cellulomonas bogoriensis]KGM13919.1 glycine/betaine ABC transporter substrate-binding protein [Cellulomonas bogoriensis 69B4 = DSM 16987]